MRISPKYSKINLQRSKNRKNIFHLETTIKKIKILSNKLKLPNHTNKDFYFNSKEDGESYKLIPKKNTSEQTADKLLLFRKDIQPTWEDKLNKIGGNFCLEMQGLTGPEMDAIWKKLLLLCFGENWEFAQYVNGLRFVDRLKKFNTFKFEIWTTLGDKNEEFDRATVRQMRNEFRERLHALISPIRDFHPETLIFHDHAKKKY